MNYETKIVRPTVVGFYITPNKNKIQFIIENNQDGGGSVKMRIFGKHHSLIPAFGHSTNGKMYVVYIPHDDFMNFTNNVIDKGKRWTIKQLNDVNIVEIPGLWVSFSEERKDTAKQLLSSLNQGKAEDWEPYLQNQDFYLAGRLIRRSSKHIPRSSRRKPTKRRRNRRGNRKTKKN